MQKVPLHNNESVFCNSIKMFWVQKIATPTELLRSGKKFLPVVAFFAKLKVRKLS